MKFDKKSPPREFDGAGNPIKDFGDIHLESREQVTFVTPSGKRSDFTAMTWGFYLTNSLNGRLRKEGFKTALVKSSSGRLYLNLVEQDKVSDFKAYLDAQKSEILSWLDE